MGKLVIVAHGIGDNSEGFHEAWADKLHENHPDLDFDVKGLLWDDVLDRVQDQYPLVEEQFAEAVAKIGFDELKNILNADGYAKFHEYAMDVLVYTGLRDMTHFVQATCALRLKALVGNRSKSTILIGHSLGAAMLPHIVWLERQATGAIPYYGMILLACPLGIRSPIPSQIDDLLGIMAGMSGQGRTEVLKSFADEWFFADDRLKFILNEYDPVCSDVKMKFGNQEIDPIGPRQEFTEREKRALDDFNPGCLIEFAHGSRKPADVFGNHDVMRYFDRDEFKASFEGMFQ